MTLLLALLTLRCADESALSRLYAHDGTSIRTTARVCRPTTPKPRVVAD